MKRLLPLILAGMCLALLGAAGENCGSNPPVCCGGKTPPCDTPCEDLP